MAPRFFRYFTNRNDDAGIPPPGLILRALVLAHLIFSSVASVLFARVARLEFLGAKKERDERVS